MDKSPGYIALIGSLTLFSLADVGSMAPSIDEQLAGFCNLIYNDKNLKHIEKLPSHMLPPGTFYLIAEGVLGVDMKWLVRLFISCRHEIDQLLRTRDDKGGDLDKAWNLTLLGMIVSYEHLTLINIRKKLVQNQPSVALEELRLLNVIFSSPFPKQTKSPLLWEHRRWLITEYLYRSSASDLSPAYTASLEYCELKPDSSMCMLEIAQCLKADNRHPKNYYALNHARWALEKFPESPAILCQLVFIHCSRNISDISLWSFLFHLAAKADPHTLQLYLKKAQEVNRVAPNHAALEWFIKYSSKLSEQNHQSMF